MLLFYDLLRLSAVRSSTGEEPCVDFTSQLSSQHENSCRKGSRRRSKGKASNQMSARRRHCAWTCQAEAPRRDRPSCVACETIEPLADIAG